jgi:hypothetical protein
VADEVIDLFLPVLFYWVRRWRWERLHAVDIVNAQDLSRVAQSAGPRQTLPPKVQT